MPPLSQINVHDHLWFMCTDCPRTFQNHRILKNHKRTSHGISGLECNSMFVFSREELDPGLSILRLIPPQILEVPTSSSPQKNASLREKSPILQIKESPPEPEPGPSRRKRRQTIEVMVISTNKENGNEQNTFKYGKSLIQADEMNEGLLHVGENNSECGQGPRHIVGIERDPLALSDNDDERLVEVDPIQFLTSGNEDCSSNNMDYEDSDDVKVEYEDATSYGKEQVARRNVEIETENTLTTVQSVEIKTEVETLPTFSGRIIPDSSQPIDSTTESEIDMNTTEGINHEENGLLEDNTEEEEDHGFEDFSSTLAQNQARTQPFFAECNFCKETFNVKFDFALHTLDMHSWPSSSNDVSVKSKKTNQQYFKCNVCPRVNFAKRERFAEHLLETGHVKAKLKSDGTWKFVEQSQSGFKQTVTVQTIPVRKGMRKVKGNKTTTKDKPKVKVSHKKNALPKAKISTPVQSQKSKPNTSTEDTSSKVSPDEGKEPSPIPVSVVINPLACTICERSFRREDYRRTHESQVHGIIHKNEKDRQELSNISEDDSDSENGSGMNVDDDDDDDEDFEITEAIDPVRESNDQKLNESDVDEEEIIGYEDFSSVSTNLALPEEFIAKCNLCKEKDTEKETFDDKFSFALHSLLQHPSPNNSEGENSTISIDNFFKAIGMPESGVLECNICIGQVFENRESSASHLLRAGHLKAKLGNGGIWNFIPLPRGQASENSKRKTKNFDNSDHAKLGIEKFIRSSTRTPTGNIDLPCILVNKFLKAEKKSTTEGADRSEAKPEPSRTGIYKCKICLGSNFESRSLFVTHLLREGHVKVKTGKLGNWEFTSKPASQQKRKTDGNDTISNKTKKPKVDNHLKSDQKMKPGFKGYKGYRQGTIPALICQACEESPVILKSREDFTDHVCQVHQENENSTRCSVCEKLLLTQSALERHFRKDHTIFSQVDHPGGITAIVDDGKTLIYRRRVVYPKHSRRFQCDECKRYFTQEADLKDHKNIHLGLKPYKCSYCEKSFPTKQSLASHERLHKNVDKFECKICGKKFNSRPHHDIHVSTHAAGQELKCEECGKFFKNSFRLYRHRTIHKPKELKKKFECELCGKNLINPHSLRLHMKSHLGIKNFECDQCNKKFIHEHSLKRHKQRIHDGFSKIHVCSICGMTFKNDWALDAHEKKHSNDLPFECEICHKRYAIKKYLTDHTYWVHRERKFTCEICGDGFKSAAHLRQHASVHTGVPLRYPRKTKPTSNSDGAPKSKSKKPTRKRKRKDENEAETDEEHGISGVANQAETAENVPESQTEHEHNNVLSDKESTEQEYVTNVGKTNSLFKLVG